MYIKFLILTTLFIPTSQEIHPTLTLNTSAQNNYFEPGVPLEIQCSIEPHGGRYRAQLWYVDLRTRIRTPVSLTLVDPKLHKEDGNNRPEIFQRNQDNRISYPMTNSLKFSYLTLEDSARYECDCPDCIEQLKTEFHDVFVMKLADPVWQIEPDGPIKENTSVTFRCVTTDFFPYMSHRILRNHHDVTAEGQPTLPTSNSYPQTFSWEANLTPTADWHNTLLQCIVSEGSELRRADHYIQVLFEPRFVKCVDRQYVDSSQENSTIECSYSGNPEPQLQWYRQSDGLPLNDIDGVTIEKFDEHHGRYRSVVRFDRDKLMAIPLTTRAPISDPGTGTGDATTTIANLIIQNYYQQLLNGGFIAKLIQDNEEKGTQKIQIVNDVKQTRNNPADNTSAGTLVHRSTSVFLFFLTTFLYSIQHP